MLSTFCDITIYLHTRCLGSFGFVLGDLSDGRVCFRSDWAMMRNRAGRKEMRCFEGGIELWKFLTEIRSRLVEL